MAATVLVSILCGDRPGLIAAITGRLYDLGANLGDATFAVLGGAAEMTAVVDLPGHLTQASVEKELRALPELKGAELTVAPFAYQPAHAPTAKITHRIEITGKDSPGLIARVSEVLGDFGANIVRLNSERIPGTDGAKYVVRIAAWVPPEKATTCMATIANTAAQLHLTCWWDEV
jgi:glycine cleavage system transcriptional repressor